MTDDRSRTEAGYKRLLEAVDEIKWLGPTREPAGEPNLVRERPAGFTGLPDIGIVALYASLHGLTPGEALKFLQLKRAMKANFDRSRKK